MRDESTLFRDLIAFALEWKELLTLISTPYLSLTHSTHLGVSSGGWGKEASPHTHSLMTTFSSSKQVHTSAAIPIPSRYFMTDDNNLLSRRVCPNIHYPLFIQLTPFPQCFSPCPRVSLQSTIAKTKKKVQEIKIKPKSLTGKYLPTW